MFTRVSLRTNDESLLVPATGTTTVIHAIYIANTSSALRRFRLHHALSGETSSAANALFYDVAIPGNSTYVDSTRIAIASGEELRGSADDSGIVATFYILRTE